MYMLYVYAHGLEVIGFEFNSWSSFIFAKWFLKIFVGSGWN